MYESDDKMVSHPKHYISKSGLEVIDVIEAFTDGLNGVEATDTGNIIKYACRWKQKGGVQDLKKIMWYTQHLIDYLEDKNEEEEHDDVDESIYAALNISAEDALAMAYNGFKEPKEDPRKNLDHSIAKALDIVDGRTCGVFEPRDIRQLVRAVMLLNGATKEELESVWYLLTKYNVG